MSLGAKRTFFASFNVQLTRCRERLGANRQSYASFWELLGAKRTFSASYAASVHTYAASVHTYAASVHTYAEPVHTHPPAFAFTFEKQRKMKESA